MRILVVDDDTDMRGLLEVYLKRWGHEVQTADNGRDALAIVASDPSLSLVITDWMMPEVDGLAVCLGVRALAVDRYLPVLLLTARAGKQALVEGLDAGADAFLSKPLDMAELQAHLRVFERVARLEAQVRASAEAAARLRELRAVVATARLLTDRINNPMFVIQMQSDLLRSAALVPAPEKITAIADRMQAAVQKVSECVHALAEVVQPVIDEHPTIGPVLNLQESTAPANGGKCP